MNTIHRGQLISLGSYQLPVDITILRAYLWGGNVIIRLILNYSPQRYYTHPISISFKG